MSDNLTRRDFIKALSALGAFVGFPVQLSEPELEIPAPPEQIKPPDTKPYVPDLDDSGLVCIEAKETRIDFLRHYFLDSSGQDRAYVYGAKIYFITLNPLPIPFDEYFDFALYQRNGTTAIAGEGELVHPNSVQVFRLYTEYHYTILTKHIPALVRI